MKLLSALDHSSRLRSRAPRLELEPTDLLDLSARIERFGLGSIEPSILVDLAGRARLVGIHPEVADLLTDVEAPTVVRARAFGLVHRRLATRAPAGTDPVPAAA